MKRFYNSRIAKSGRPVALDGNLPLICETQLRAGFIPALSASGLARNRLGVGQVRAMLKRLIVVGALLGASYAVWGKELAMAQCLKLLESPKTRARALEPLLSQAFSCSDEKARARCRTLLLAWLKQERDSAVRSEVAGLLGNFLAYESTPTADFEKCFGLLTDRDAQVAHAMWVEFGQQASLKGMTSSLRDRMLALSEDARPEVRLQAVSWAHQQALQSGVHGEPVPKEFQLKALKVVQGHLQDADSQVRNEAFYGCLALSKLDPDGTEALVLSHLRDQNPNTRSLILDYLEQHPIPGLAAELEKRLGELNSDSKEHFPSPEDELNPPGRAPEEPEPYRVVRALFHLGPLSPGAWSYLETRGLQQVNPTELLAFVSECGPEAGPFADKLWSKFPQEHLVNAVSAWADRGLSGERLTWLQNLTEKQDTRETEGQLQKASYLAVLANSPSNPRSIQLAVAALKDKDQNVRVAAVYALARLDPQGAGGQAARQALQGLGSEKYFLDADMLLAAAARLGAPDWLSKEPLLHPDRPADPRWLEFFGASSRISQGARLDSLKLQLRWLEAHPAQAAKVLEGLRALTRSPNSEVVELARASLAKLQPKP